MEDLNPRASVIFGKRGCELAGIDSSFDLMMCIGVHVNHSLTSHADKAEHCGAKRIDGRTICLQGDDVLTVFDMWGG